MEIFARHVVWAGPDTCTVFSEPSPEFEQHLLNTKSRSEFSADVELDPGAHYVLALHLRALL